MKNIGWYYYRLKAMNLREIPWRIKRKVLQRKEYRDLYQKHLPVTHIALPSKYSSLQIDANRVPFSGQNNHFHVNAEICLLGAYSYGKYKRDWNAGFNTPNRWPEIDFSYDIAIGNRSDIGDIRINWELNRHYQFTVLAKNYYYTGGEQYLTELKDLFADWNQHNLFLHGVQWTSPMEVAVRINSWIFTYAFLAKAVVKHKHNEDIKLLKDLEHGILAMADYVVRHRSRYSSANNHLIVEMYAVAISGIVFDYKPWKEYAIYILIDELQRQNTKDGVNREMSLHYQAFVMEAYGLLSLFMKKNVIKIPNIFVAYLTTMSEFLADSCGKYGETIIFGDNDEGKLLDLCGTENEYYSYILQLMGCILNKQFSERTPNSESLSWLVKHGDTQTDDIGKATGLAYVSPYIKSYKEGGYTFLRSKDLRVLIGIDHADLGFGRLAAHGHADALSFQMFIDGEAIFADPGTFTYHFHKADRDMFRSTVYHNTVLVDNLEQSQMLGSFLWGKRAKSKLLGVANEEQHCVITAQTMYENIIHTRTLTFDYVGGKSLQIEDILSSKQNHAYATAVFHLGVGIEISEHTETYLLLKHKDKGVVITVRTKDSVFTSECYRYSPTYGKEEKSTVLQNKVNWNNGATIVTVITWE